MFASDAVKSGAVVIDNTSAFRMDPNTPLIVPEVNPQELKNHSGIIANPNCSTIQMVAALKQNGVTVSYIRAKDEGHSLAKKTNRDYTRCLYAGCFTHQAIYRFYDRQTRT